MSTPPLITLEKTEKTVAQTAAEVIEIAINQQLAKLAETHRQIWETLWDNPDGAEAADILAALGSQAVMVLQAGAQSVADLTACAILAGTTVEAILGESKYLTAGAPIIIHQDGTVTIQEQQS